MKSRRRSSRTKALLLLAIIPELLIGYLCIELYLEFPDVLLLKSHYPVVQYAGPKRAPAVSIQKHRPPYWVPLKDLSRAAMGAVIVSEDWAFFQHPGYDLNQIEEVMSDAVEEGHFKRGASTITQQVAKNIYLSREKTITRKAKEFFIALSLEKNLGKRKILELYFNIAEWGEGIYGIGAASQHYFGKPPSALLPKEGAFLAMLLPSPIKYSVSFRKKELSPFARKTTLSILNKMKQAKFLTDEEYATALSTPLSWETHPTALTDTTTSLEGADENSDEKSDDSVY